MTVRTIGPSGAEAVTATLVSQQPRSVPIVSSTATDAFIGGKAKIVRTVIATQAYPTQFAATVVVQQTTYNYKLRGWDALVRSFETWVSTDPESAAPSGHTLVGREISAKWAV